MIMLPVIENIKVQDGQTYNFVKAGILLFTTEMFQQTPVLSYSKPAYQSVTNKQSGDGVVIVDCECVSLIMQKTHKFSVTKFLLKYLI